MPANLNDALAALSHGRCSIIAGGTDWFPSQGDALAKSDLLNVTRIDGLRGITCSGVGWRIGAATTWTDIASATLPAAFRGLQLAAREVGSVQIQNTGTVAGNICNASPAADGVPPLLTLNAVVELASVHGSRRIPLAEFITGPRKTLLQTGEMITALHIPAVEDGFRGSFIKLGARKYLVISVTMVAALVSVSDGRISMARIAVGAASPVATRLTRLEAALIGADKNSLADRLTAEMTRELTPITDIRGSAEYRSDAVAELIRRTLADAIGG